MKQSTSNISETSNGYVLLLLWGWLGFINNFFFGYIPGVVAVGYWYGQAEQIMKILIPICGLGYTLYYLLQYRKGKFDQSALTILYVWIALIASMVIVNLIIFKVTGGVNFSLQHPIFMTFMAFAIIITGQVINQRLVILGGVVFAGLALVSSYMDLSHQLLLESVGWIVAFVLPGHWIQLKSIGISQ
jgi:hypothetical protein